MRLREHVFVSVRGGVERWGGEGGGRVACRVFLRRVFRITITSFDTANHCLLKTPLNSAWDFSTGDRLAAVNFFTTLGLLALTTLVTMPIFTTLGSQPSSHHAHLHHSWPCPSSPLLASWLSALSSPCPSSPLLAMPIFTTLGHAHLHHSWPCQSSPLLALSPLVTMPTLFRPPF